MTNNSIDFDTAMEIASHEAIIRQAYKDSVGVWTWSVGLTSATGHSVKRYINRPQTTEHCLRIYVWALDRYADQVRKVFRAHTLTPTQFAAALSFHWNTGSIGRASWVNLWKAGKITEARLAFMDWRKPPEIIGRRKKERNLFFNGTWTHKGSMIEFTRLTSRSTPVWSSGLRINVAQQLKAALEPQSPIILDHDPDPNAQVVVQVMGDPVVRDYQTRLTALGYKVGPIDGIAGVKTRAALRGFQRAMGITIDGDWGPESAAALKRAEGAPDNQPDDPGPIIPDPEPAPDPDLPPPDQDDSKGGGLANRLKGGGGSSRLQ